MTRAGPSDTGPAPGTPTAEELRRALKAFRELLYLYTTREELAVVFRQALDEPEDAPVKAERIAVAQDAAWERRVEQLRAFLGVAEHSRDPSRR